MKSDELLFSQCEHSVGVFFLFFFSAVLCLTSVYFWCELD